MPEISVIIPVYNGEKLIEKAVSSVLSQSFEDFELIIVNDGSRDKTEEICRRLSSDGRVRLFNKENAGVSEARNDGISMARGKYIAFLDADDTYETDFLSSLMSLIKETGASAAHCADTCLLPDGTGTYEAPAAKAGFYTPDEARELVVLPLLSGRLAEKPFNGFIWRFIYRADIIKDNKLRFSGAYLEDELFLIEYFSLGASLAITEKALYNYLINPASVTHKYLPDYPDTFLKSFEMKKALCERFSLSLPGDWENSTVWAGILIEAGNEFAPGNSACAGEKKRKLRAVFSSEPYASAIRNYTPSGMNKKKMIVARLIKMKLYGTLTLLYRIKNRNRS
ncbi:MAG: glycosyltransferase [Oscillospiraceae bacterium]|nr:glycosyltransferase [Oscillospiraceae bacterium]